MKDLLDKLYDYDLFHLTANYSKDEEYRSALERLVKLEADILKAFPEIKELLEEYTNLFLRIRTKTVTTTFSLSTASPASFSASAYSMRTYISQQGFPLLG